MPSFMLRSAFPEVFPLASIKKKTALPFSGAEPGELSWIAKGRFFSFCFKINCSELKLDFPLYTIFNLIAGYNDESTASICISCAFAKLKINNARKKKVVFKKVDFIGSVGVNV